MNGNKALVVSMVLFMFQGVSWLSPFQEIVGAPQLLALRQRLRDLGDSRGVSHAPGIAGAPLPFVA